MSRGINEYSNVLLRLVGRNRRTERNRLRHNRIEVAHLKVEMHHRTLFFRLRWPNGSDEVGGFLEYDVYRSVRRRDDCGARFLVNERPTEQLGDRNLPERWDSELQWRFPTTCRSIENSYVDCVTCNESPLRSRSG